MYYRGTTTLDFLLKRQDLRLKFNRNNNNRNLTAKKPFAFIINTIHSNDTRMGHWVAITINNRHPHCRKITVRYFDSFGGSYLTHKPIASYIHNIKKCCEMYNYIFELDTSKKVIQYYNSTVCGLYTAYFVCKVAEHCDSLPISNIFKHFKNDRRDNDAKVVRFLEYNYPAKSCNRHDDMYSGKKASLKQLLRAPTPFCSKHTFGLKKCFKTIKCHCDSNEV